MTGEITLTGEVLPIGGLLEKVLAAHRVGINRVIIPAANEPDLDDIPPEVAEDINFIPVRNVDEVWDEIFPGILAA
jgi:ATP-dependent Lon protease